MRLRDSRLRKEALESCIWRGHTMKKFKWSRYLYYPENYEKGFSSCINCGREVVVIPFPGPNKIDIGGEAVAVSCDDKPSWDNAPEWANVLHRGQFGYWMWSDKLPYPKRQILASGEKPNSTTWLTEEMRDATIEYRPEV